MGSRSSVRVPDHPRIRGEHELVSTCHETDCGSSPHTRGAPRTVRGHADPPVDHPRIRGEHLLPLRLNNICRGSSPHTRGARDTPCCEIRLFGIIPAYAGSTCRLVLFCYASRDHPRIRGEHFLSFFRDARLLGSSPHTRGALPPPSASHVLWGDHPRIRGEHIRPPLAERGPDGSSPHTRGAHLGIPAIPRIAAVIIPVFLYPSPTPQEEADRSMVLLTLS